MNLIIYLIIAGTVVGYIASIALRTNSPQGTLINIVTAIVGGSLAGYFISPLLEGGTINDTVTIPTMLIIPAGSVVMLWIVKAVHRKESNTDKSRILTSGSDK